MKFKKNVVLSVLMSLSLLIGFFSMFHSTSIEVYSEDNKVHSVPTNNKVTYVFVWSSTCGSCVYNLSDINLLKQRVEELGGKFLLVLSEDKLILRQMGKASCIRLNLEDLESFYDKDQVLQKKFRINVVPTLLIFSKNGKMVKRIEGAVPWGENGNMQEALEFLN
jgi:thiol-disulfide isomerase/thioredoxin